MKKDELIKRASDSIDSIGEISPWHRGFKRGIYETLINIKKLDEPEITEDQAWEVIGKEKGMSAAQASNTFTQGKASVFGPVKPVIPQFVARFIESNKRDENGLWSVISRINKISDSPISSKDLEIIEWVYGSNVKVDKMYARQEIIALAWLNGYTIEPPKTLQVIVRNYNSTVFKTDIPEDEAMKLIEGWKEDE